MSENLAKFCPGCGHPIVLMMLHRILKQNNLEATYCTQRFPEDGNINWNKSSIDVYNFILSQFTDTIPLILQSMILK